MSKYLINVQCFLLVPLFVSISLLGPFPVTCLMVGSVVLTLAPDEHFLHPVNITGVNETVGDERLMEVDIEAREAQRILVACTMTMLVGLFQVKSQHSQLKPVIKIK